MVYGLSENIGLHIILSNLFWWASVIVALLAYRYRKAWNVGKLPWAFFFLMFLSFGFRELGHLTTSTILGGVRYAFGMWSALFMASTFAYLASIFYLRKKPSAAYAYLPFVVMLVFPAFFGHLYYTGMSDKDAKNAMGSIENMLWILSGTITVWTTYLLGSRSTGGFVRFYMLFHFAAYMAVTWKVLGVFQVESYAIREVIETLFGFFAAMAMCTLAVMLKKNSGRMGAG